MTRYHGTRQNQVKRRGAQQQLAEQQTAVRTAIVAEAHAADRTLLATLLEESEYSVVECESGEAALAAMRVRGSSVALMFADDSLAGVMDGVELARKAKEQRPHLTVVLSSDHRDPRMEGLPDEVVVISKPWLSLEVLIIAERAKSAALDARPR